MRVVMKADIVTNCTQAPPWLAHPSHILAQINAINDTTCKTNKLTTVCKLQDSFNQTYIRAITEYFINIFQF